MSKNQFLQTILNKLYGKKEENKAIKRYICFCAMFSQIFTSVKEVGDQAILPTFLKLLRNQLRSSYTSFLQQTSSSDLVLANVNNSNVSTITVMFQKVLSIPPFLNAKQLSSRTVFFSSNDLLGTRTDVLLIRHKWLK